MGTEKKLYESSLYKSNTMIFYKDSTRCAWSGLLSAPSKAHCRFRFKNIMVLLLLIIMKMYIFCSVPILYN